MVTGTSVLAIRFKDGVVVAADTLASYGSLARYRDVRRMEEVSGTLVAGGGDYSDLQEVLEMSHFLSYVPRARSIAARRSAIAARCCVGRS